MIQILAMRTPPTMWIHVRLAANELDQRAASRRRRWTTSTKFYPTKYLNKQIRITQLNAGRSDKALK